jgi:hypothetical protein
MATDGNVSDVPATDVRVLREIQRTLGASVDTQTRCIFGSSLRLREQPGYYASGRLVWFLTHFRTMQTQTEAPVGDALISIFFSFKKIKFEMFKFKNL